MPSALEIIVFGTAMGGIFALLASGFSLIFGVSRILNFAHGACFAISAYLAILLVNEFSFNVYFATLFGVIASILLGFMVYCLTRPIRSNIVMVIIVTLAFALLVEQILLLNFGDRGLTLKPFVEGIQVIHEDLRIAKIRILAIFIAIGLILLLEIFVNGTILGKRINAVSQDSESAMLLGINVEWIYLATMTISSALAGFSGILYAQIFNIYPELVLRVLIYAFAVVILGGLGSLRGSILASFIIGYLFVITTMLLGAQWSEFVMLLAIVSILILRPTGLFGVKE
ncbi:MAG: branched-chain amino acid ABC transporter permease [Archaeoglobaceae archaeon]|nr:branched-chain amino acid ABC transporter permease [Archaeoglobaceae archaeon]MDW8128190.1 branched-chain amino acid ABC transporter permease [Archaeoglobaceae archaeon]